MEGKIAGFKFKSLNFQWGFYSIAVEVKLADMTVPVSHHVEIMYFHTVCCLFKR
jgi:hypothetical protein